LTKYARREKIWQSWDNFLKQKNTWYTENFRTMDAEAIVKIVSKFNKDNNEMKMKMRKDETDEVLD
jgi:hypothetical protein